VNEHADPLVVALTRPQMKLGVTVESIIIEFMIMAMVVNFTGNPLFMLLVVPIHCVFMYVCRRDPFFFPILFKVARNRLAFTERMKSIGVKTYVGS